MARVFEQLGPDWGPFDAFVDRLAEVVHDGFLSASVLHSDGAFVHIGVPHVGIDRCWLHLDGVVSHFVVGMAPFDEDGNMLPDDVIEELDAETERETLEYAERLRGLALQGDAAAAACRDWARASGLVPAPVEAVRAALEAHHVFVEETFDGLLVALGAMSPPAPEVASTR